MELAIIMMTPSDGNIFPRHWPFVKGIHWTPLDSPHKIQWCGALMYYLVYAWTNGWAKNRDAGDLRRHHTHYDVTKMTPYITDRVWGHGDDSQMKFFHQQFSLRNYVPFPCQWIQKWQFKLILFLECICWPIGRSSYIIAKLINRSRYRINRSHLTR